MVCLFFLLCLRTLLLSLLLISWSIRFLNYGRLLPFVSGCLRVYTRSITLRRGFIYVLIQHLAYLLHSLILNRWQWSMSTIMFRQSFNFDFSYVFFILQMSLICISMSSITRFPTNTSNKINSELTHWTFSAQ